MARPTLSDAEDHADADDDGNLGRDDDLLSEKNSFAFSNHQIDLIDTQNDENNSRPMRIDSRRQRAFGGDLEYDLETGHMVPRTADLA